MKNLTVLLFILFINISTHAQKTVEFEDGTTIEYEVLENNYRSMKKLALQLNLLHMHDIQSFVTVNYTFPQYGMIRSHWGLGYLGFEGTVFLPRKDIETTHEYKLRSKMTGRYEKKAYLIEEQVIKKNTFGLRIGYALKDYSKSLAHQNEQHIKTKEFLFGVSYTKLMHMKMKIEAVNKNGFKKYTQIGASDFISYNIDFFYIPYIELLSSNSDLNTTNIGARAFLEGKARLFSKIPLSLGFSFGGTYTAYKRTQFMGGVGLVLDFF